MKDIICIDGSYPSEYLAFYARYGVIVPEEGRVDQIREVVKHSNGQVGIRLVGLKNPEVPLTHPVLGEIMMEPSFHVRRFTDLLGNVLDAREVVKRFKSEKCT